MENPPDRHPSQSRQTAPGPGTPDHVEGQRPWLPSSPPSPGPGPLLTDMDCPVCFCTYDIYRVPKELSCKHNFCAVCLKLLLRNEAGAWRVLCPVCRVPTTVFGGLVCTLPNQESFLSRMENPRAEGPEPSGGPAVAVSLGGHGRDRGDAESHLTIAARRLVILLLILLILLIIILQFVYTGIMKWVLGSILGVVVIVTVLLCFNPNCSMSLPQGGAQQKDNDPEPGVGGLD